MTGGLADLVAVIGAMTPVELVREWERVHGTPAPAVTSSLLVRDLAHRMQQAAAGGPDKRLERRVRDLVEASADAGISREGKRAALGGGTQQLREWGGKTHRVTVEPDGGFVYAGQTWRSLSAIARAITGARWSGPRFFGTRS